MIGWAGLSILAFAHELPRAHIQTRNRMRMPRAHAIEQPLDAIEPLLDALQELHSVALEWRSSPVRVR